MRIICQHSPINIMIVFLMAINKIKTTLEWGSCNNTFYGKSGKVSIIVFLQVNKGVTVVDLLSFAKELEAQTDLMVRSTALFFWSDKNTDLYAFTAFHRHTTWFIIYLQCCRSSLVYLHLKAKQRRSLAAGPGKVASNFYSSIKRVGSPPVTELLLSVQGGLLLMRKCIQSSF